MVALGRVVLSKRERVIMLQPRGKGLLGATLRYPYEVRDEAIYFGDIGDIQIPKDMLALAEHILESKAATFDPTLFHDRYEEAVVAMLNEKRAGMPIPKAAPDAEDCRGHRSDGGVAAEHREGEGRDAKGGRQTSAARRSAAATKPAAAAKGKRDRQRQLGPARDAVADCGRRAREGSRRARKGSAGETDRAKAWRAEEGGLASRLSAP